MPRNISFALTVEQFQNRTKTVTRRIGWRNLKTGDVLMGCKKCMGLKPGDKLERLGLIEVVDVRREPLADITDQDVANEGFPELSRTEFIDLFMDSYFMNDRNPNRCVTRIEFKYLD